MQRTQCDHKRFDHVKLTRLQWRCVVCTNNAIEILTRTWLFSRSIVSELRVGNVVACARSPYFLPHAEIGDVFTQATNVVEELVVICHCNPSKSKPLYVNFLWNLTRVCVAICHLETAKTRRQFIIRSSRVDQTLRSKLIYNLGLNQILFLLHKYGQICH